MTAMSQAHGRDRQEAALLDVVRLALAGDQRSLCQRARNLLRTGDCAVLSEAGRRYLQELLTAGGDHEPLRAVRRLSAHPARSRCRARRHPFRILRVTRRHRC